MAQRLPRQRFLAAVILFFVGCIQLFFVGSRLGVPHLGFLFFVWVGIFSLTTIAQFWSYANEIYNRDDGQPALPAHRGGIGGGRSAGSVRRRAALRSPLEPVHPDAGRGRDAPRPPRPVPRRQPARGRRRRGHASPMKGGNGFALVLKSRYLTLIALLLVLLNIVNTVGEYILGQAVVAAADAQLAARPASTRRRSSAASTAGTSS